MFVFGFYTSFCLGGGKQIFSDTLDNLLRVIASSKAMVMKGMSMRTRWLMMII